MSWPSSRESHSCRDLSIHQTLYNKALYEYAGAQEVAVVASSSPLFRNSSLGPNLLALSRLNFETIDLFAKIFLIDDATSSTLQFTKKLFVHVTYLECDQHRAKLQSLRFLVTALAAKSKYFSSSLRSLTIATFSECTSEILRDFGLQENVTSLDLRFYDMTVDLSPLLSSIVPVQFPRLTTVNTSSSPSITDKDVSIIVGGLNNLTEVDFSGSVKLTKRSWHESFAPAMNRLKVLRLASCDGVDDEEIQKFTQACSRSSSATSSLTTLDLLHFDSITDVGFIAISSTFTSLRELNLSSSKNLTDKTIFEGVAPHLLELSVLSLSRCNNISDASLTAIGSTLFNLASLDLTECNLITDDGLSHVIASCIHLEKLILTECHKIGNKTLKLLGSSKLTKLKVLNLWHCGEITDSGIADFANEETCPFKKSLEILVLGKHAGVSNLSLPDYLCHISSLAKLYLIGIDSNAKPDIVKKFDEKMPGVKVFAQ